MAMTNYFQPLLAVLSYTDCSDYQIITNITELSSVSFNSSSDLITNLTEVSSFQSISEVPWQCDQYNGQLIYATLYGITRFGNH